MLMLPYKIHNLNRHVTFNEDNLRSFLRETESFTTLYYTHSWKLHDQLALMHIFKLLKFC